MTSILRTAVLDADYSSIQSQSSSVLHGSLNSRLPSDGSYRLSELHEINFKTLPDSSYGSILSLPSNSEDKNYNDKKDQQLEVLQKQERDNVDNGQGSAFLTAIQLAKTVMKTELNTSRF